ncbi:MAG: 5-deoxy-glucuronate isomerase [Acidimicrobiia bacterium]|nr:5-deoxy-glucuronate isomerase [Acidimicrobiia bacterium]
MSEYLYPAGTTAQSGSSVAIDPELAGWSYCGLQVLQMGPGDTRVVTTGDDEAAILPLAGECVVAVEGMRFEVDGRDSVFSGIAGFAYVPIDSEVQITSPTGGEIAVCTARATRHIDPYAVPARAVSVEVRGASTASRQINNFLSASFWEADKLIAVEVLTPEGGWSSYPAHKHDEMSETEVELEEIYYFRIDGAGGSGFFTCYTMDGEIAETVTVHDGDAFLVPKGFHGPAAAFPGHHMYYLNVMAGPSQERKWNICNDPRQEPAMARLMPLGPDPRLPLTAAD